LPKRGGRGPGRDFFYPKKGKKHEKCKKRKFLTALEPLFSKIKKAPQIGLEKVLFGPKKGQKSAHEFAWRPFTFVSEKAKDGRNFRQKNPIKGVSVIKSRFSR